MMLFMGALRHIVRIAGVVLRSAALRAGKQQVYKSRQNVEPCTLQHPHCCIIPSFFQARSL